MRPADQIDISEAQLQSIKDVFEQQKTGVAANCVSFFLAVRKAPKIKQVATAIARDPEGTSRIPRETFQQVFDRMEQENVGKAIEWATIVEYFTKRGRPLSKEEIKHLVQEDQRMREEEEEQKRVNEEHERRRHQRLMENLEEEEDFEAYEARCSKENGAAGPSGGKDTRGDSDQEDSGENDGELSDEFDREDDDLVGTGLTRARSAKVIQPQRLSAKDYMTAENAKKGKYGITVPKPFAFDLRDKVRPKSIRERKVEQMVMEKKMEEQALKKHAYRAKPIPPEVIQPRFQAITEANENRRQRILQESKEITKQREAPFNFWLRDQEKMAKKASMDDLNIECRRPSFKANPIPKACSVLIYN